MRTRLSTMVAALLLVAGGALAQDKSPAPAPQPDAVAAPAASPEFSAWPHRQLLIQLELR